MALMSGRRHTHTEKGGAVDSAKRDERMRIKIWEISRVSKAFVGHLQREKKRVRVRVRVRVRTSKSTSPEL